jgi:hypothetical protein
MTPEEIVELLLKKGKEMADLKTCLAFVPKDEELRLAVVKILTDKGLNIHARDDNFTHEKGAEWSRASIWIGNYLGKCLIRPKGSHKGIIFDRNRQEIIEY